MYKNNTDKPIIQVCFSLKNDLTMDVIRQKLKNLKEKLDAEFPKGYKVKSCHLNRAICIEQNFSTDIPDMFDDIFGTDYECMVTAVNMQEAKLHMQMYRETLSKQADKLVILSETELTNVALEIELFTKNQIIIV